MLCVETLLDLNWKLMSQEQETRELHKGGVKTEEGKAISRYNAQRHSILRDALTDYERIDAGKIYDELVDDIKPAGRTQELLLEVLVSNVIRLQRITRAESETVLEVLSEPTSLGFRGLRSREYDPTISFSTAEKLSLYSRYQTATENRIYRALGMLKHLKTNEQSA